ncbi:MAG: hypothetical protein J1F63_00635 [Oscillospiraceae bacterium]|nr:hypothetical protein [Oscillospiraceae bacterium]
MKSPSATEVAVQLAKKLERTDIYLKALDAEKEGKTLAEFIKTLEVLKNEA